MVIQSYVKSSTDSSPDLFLYSKPNPENALTVSVTTFGQHAYIANQLGNSVSFCQANPVTGFLRQCAITATGLSGLEGIGFNPTGIFLYSANARSNSIDGTGNMGLNSLGTLLTYLMKFSALYLCVTLHSLMVVYQGADYLMINDLSGQQVSY